MTARHNAYVSRPSKLRAAGETPMIPAPLAHVMNDRDFAVGGANCLAPQGTQLARR